MTLQQSQMLEELFSETYMPLVMYATAHFKTRSLLKSLLRMHSPSPALK